MFSLDLMGCYEEDGSLPAYDLAVEMGMTPRPNGKLNIGIGSPFFAGRREERN